MSRVAKLESIMRAVGHYFDELVLVAPSTHPLAGRVPQIRSFPCAETLWSDLSEIRSQCDLIIALEEALGIARLFQNRIGSHIWFAAHVGDLCESLLRRRTPGDLALSQTDLEDCIKLGSFLTRWEWRTNYGADIKTGRPVGTTLARQRKTKNDAAHRRMMERRRHIAALLRERTQTGKAPLTGGPLETFLVKELKKCGFTVTGRTVRSDLKSLPSP